MKKTLLLLLTTAALMATAPSSAQTVRCESDDGRYRECAVDGFGAVTLTRQVSDSNCVEGRTWGTRDGKVWVDGGCRGEFARVSPGMRFSTITCESIDGKRANCFADTTGGVRLARRLSDRSCEFGRQWGYDDRGIWVVDGCRAEFSVRGRGVTSAAIANPRIISCASNNERRQHCDAETHFGIALYRQASERPCVLNRTWGIDPDGIWVTEGCRGEFVLGDLHVASAGSSGVAVAVPVPVVIDSGSMASSAPIGMQTGGVVCESIDGRRNRCAANTAYGVSILRQISDSNCLLNQTWGVDADGVWVSGGCRAEFMAGGPNLALETSSAPSTARILCESKDGKRNVCPADTRLGVAVVRQISDSNCVLNSTWGFDTNGIWVTAGCRAEFILRR